MKNYLIIFIAVISTCFVGCDLEEDFTPPNVVNFEGEEIGVSVTENSSTSREVSVYSSNITGSDRTFDISVVDSLSTLNPETYSLPSTVTIPGGSNEGTFTIDLTDTNLPNEGGTLELDLEHLEGTNRGGPMTVNVSRYCEFDRTGTYVNESEYAGASYGVVIEQGSSENEYIAKDLFEVGTDISFTVNEDLSITVPFQEAWVHSSYGQASVQGAAGSKVSPCTGQIILVVEHTVDAGTFGEMTEVLTKQ